MIKLTYLELALLIFGIGGITAGIWFLIFPKSYYNRGYSAGHHDGYEAGRIKDDRYARGYIDGAEDARKKRSEQ
jgi:hypothetical protein